MTVSVQIHACIGWIIGLFPVFCFPDNVAVTFLLQCPDKIRKELQCTQLQLYQVMQTVVTGCSTDCGFGKGRMQVVWPLQISHLCRYRTKEVAVKVERRGKCEKYLEQICKTC